MQLQLSVLRTQSAQRYHIEQTPTCREPISKLHCSCTAAAVQLHSQRSPQRQLKFTFQVQLQACTGYAHQVEVAAERKVCWFVCHRTGDMISSYRPNRIHTPDFASRRLKPNKAKAVSDQSVRVRCSKSTYAHPWSQHFERDRVSARRH